MTYSAPKAIEIAKKAHKGQRSMYDETKDFYWEHPFKVMKLARKIAPYGEKIKYGMVGVLHDVVEDTKVTLEDLKKEGIPNDVVEAVDLLTHKEGVSYVDYLIPLKKNEMARKVKLADMISNLRFFFLHNRPEKMKKYIDGINYLMDNNGEDKS